jgi:ParB-like chromosome segregation protein Spo0J
VERRRIALDELDLTLGRLRRLPESEIGRMVASLRSKGQLSAVVAARQGESLVLVDGFVRVLAARRLGLVELWVEIIEVTTAQMKAQVYLRNRERGLHLVDQCRLVRELVEVEGLTQVEVADLVERHKSWVCRRLALSRRVSSALLSEADLGRLTAGSLSRLAQLPMRNQEEVFAVSQARELSGQDVGLLAELWQRAPDPQARAYVLAHPEQALSCARGEAEQRNDPRLGPAGEEARRALETLRRTSLHLARRVQQGLGAIGEEGLGVLRRAHEQTDIDTRAALSRLRMAVEQSDDR